MSDAIRFVTKGPSAAHLVPGAHTVQVHVVDHAAILPGRAD